MSNAAPGSTRAAELNESGLSSYLRAPWSLSHSTVLRQSPCLRRIHFTGRAPATEALYSSKCAERRWGGGIQTRTSSRTPEVQLYRACRRAEVLRKNPAFILTPHAALKSRTWHPRTEGKSSCLRGKSLIRKFRTRPSCVGSACAQSLDAPSREITVQPLQAYCAQESQ